MRYKERIIEHNLHRPREYHTDSLKLQEVDFDSSVISHHPKSFEYYFTHGLVVNDRRYIVKEFFVKHGKLYAILTEDEDTYYEMYLSFLDENVIEDLKKDISDLKAKDKQFDKRLSDLENVRKQNQTLSINDRTISISGGNSIELPADKDTIYDDTALKQRVKTLEDKPDKADQTLSINDRTISISGGNSIELPIDKDTIYDDTDIKKRVSVLESKPDKDTVTKVVSTSNGVNVSSSVDSNITTYDINIDKALDNYYDKAKTYTKDEVNEIVNKQEQKATDITVYKGKFSDRNFVKEGDYDTPISPRITLTYSKSTGVGILKIDFNIVNNVFKGQVIATLPNDAPVPAELVESQVWIGNVNTSIWVNKNSRSIQISRTVDSSIFNKRIILNIPGIFKLTN